MGGLTHSDLVSTTTAKIMFFQKIPSFSDPEGMLKDNSVGLAETNLIPAAGC